MPRVRALLLAAGVFLAACASAPPVVLYPDVQVPAGWRAYTRDWVRIDAGAVTAARLVYFTEAPLDAAAADARTLLVAHGWTPRGTQPFTSPEGFRGTWADFAKGDDVCRLTLIRGEFGTHADYTLARRVAPGRR
jgi:hypothetical protein